MASNKQKKYNLKKGLLGKITADVSPVIVQSNNVARIEKELDNSREARKSRIAAKDAKTVLVPAKKQPKK